MSAVICRTCGARSILPSTVRCSCGANVDDMDRGRARLSVVPEAPKPDRPDEPASLARYRAQRAEAQIAGQRFVPADRVRDELILDALLMTGSALADHGHVWTDAERHAFESAVTLLGGDE